MVYGLIVIACYIAILIIRKVGARMIKGQEGVFSKYLASGQRAEYEGNDRQAVSSYKRALAVVLGLEQGSVELTARGVGLLFARDGSKAVEKIKAIYARNGVEYSWNELHATLEKFQELSTDKQLVDSHGLAQGKGKELLPILQDRLAKCVYSLPEIDLQLRTGARVTSQQPVPRSAAGPVVETKLASAGSPAMAQLQGTESKVAAPQPNSIGVRFDIGKINSGGYGQECWKVFWKAVDPRMLAGSQLLEGDTNNTPDLENVYCLAVKWPLGDGRGADVRKALEGCEDYQRVAAEPNFIDPAEVNKEPLVDGGKVDRSGSLIGGEYRALPALKAVRRDDHSVVEAAARVAAQAPSRLDESFIQQSGPQFEFPPTLDGAIEKYKASGYALVSKTDTSAILRRPAPTNMVILIGLLIVFWIGAIIYLLTRKKYEVELSTQPDGRVIESGGTLEEFEHDRELEAHKPRLAPLMIPAGSLFALAGVILGVVLLLSHLEDPVLSKDVQGIVITELVCPLPVLVVGSLLLGFGIRILRRKD